MFSLRIKTNNAAFAEDDKAHEVARALREVADKLDAGHDSATIRDSNGNTVGNWELT